MIFALLIGQLSVPISVLAQEASNSGQIASPSPSAATSPEPTTATTTTPQASASATIAPTPTPTPETEQASNSAKINKKDTGSFKKTTKKQVSTSAKYKEGEVLVKFKKDQVNLKNSVNRANVESFENKHSVKSTEEIKESNIKVVKSNKSTQQLVDELKKDPLVETVEPNYIRQLDNFVPNDPSFDQLWGLNNTGQNVAGVSGKSGADISATKAWDLESSSQPNVVVAVLDTGITAAHPDLAGNLWDGSNCKDENNNSIPGGCPNHGWDFADNDNLQL